MCVFLVGKGGGGGKEIAVSRSIVRRVQVVGIVSNGGGGSTLAITTSIRA